MELIGQSRSREREDAGNRLPSSSPWRSCTGFDHCRPKYINPWNRLWRIAVVLQGFSRYRRPRRVDSERREQVVEFDGRELSGAWLKAEKDERCVHGSEWIQFGCEPKCLVFAGRLIGSDPNQTFPFSPPGSRPESRGWLDRGWSQPKAEGPRTLGDRGREP